MNWDYVERQDEDARRATGVRIRRLDLGGTACYESLDAVIVSLDGTASGDRVSRRVIADFNHMPFKAAIFEEAHGSCYLEGSDRVTGQSYWTEERLQRHIEVLATCDETTTAKVGDAYDTCYNDYSELARVLVPGATVLLTGCGESCFETLDELEELSEESQVSFFNFVQDVIEELVDDIVSCAPWFKVRVENRYSYIQRAGGDRPDNPPRREIVVSTPFLHLVRNNR